MVHVAAVGGHVAAGEAAVLVAFADGAAQVHGDGVVAAGDVQRQAEGGGGPAGELVAEQGGAAAGPGQQGDGLLDEGSVPVRGGRGGGELAAVGPGR